MSYILRNNTEIDYHDFDGVKSLRTLLNEVESFLNESNETGYDVISITLTSDEGDEEYIDNLYDYEDLDRVINVTEVSDHSSGIYDWSPEQYIHFSAYI